MENILTTLARLELLQKLRDEGLGDFVDGLLETSVYTRKGRLNKSALARLLDLRPAEVEIRLNTCREILANSMGLE